MGLELDITGAGHVLYQLLGLAALDAADKAGVLDSVDNALVTP